MLKQLFYSVALLLSIFCSLPSAGQKIAVVARGKVVAVQQDQTTQSVPGANVMLLNSMTGTFTNASGAFEILVPDSFPQFLVISFVGYRNDTVKLETIDAGIITLKPSQEISQVEVEGRRESTKISTLKPINTVEIGQNELLKAACCNLSESFETNPSVNVSYTDAITGAKEIQMLGLSGIYSQLLTENIPSMRGIVAPYALGYVPGPWMESIQITKGSGSVANGFESTTGQINVEYLKPESAPQLYLNQYIASTGNIEFNAHKVFDINPRLKTMVFMHGENMGVKWDHQNDGFLDMPLVTQINLFNRWSYFDGEKWEAQFGVRGIVEDRKSGQINYTYGTDVDTTSGYGVRIRTKRVEAFSKTGRVFPKTPWKSAGLIISGSHHNMDSYFGLKKYEGTQTGFYTSLIYMSVFSNTNHKWKTGIDFRMDDYKESYLDNAFNHTEAIPGMYFEYTGTFFTNFTMIAGSRIDHHNQFGWFYTPRLHMKYNFTPDLIWRVSAGTSFRTSNVIAENISTLTTSRSLLVTESLNPERARNFGTNITARFRLFYRSGSVSADFYRTDFQNQVIVDMYTSDEFIFFYNLKGNSSSTSYQLAIDYELFKRLDFRIAFKYDDVVADFNGVSASKPLVAPKKGLVNFAYSTVSEKWRFDLTMQYQGEARLAIPATGTHIHDNHSGHDQLNGNKSPDFVTFNTQVTRVIKIWELYLGVENITDFHQEVPVMGASDPFGPEFDATNIWGPIMGRKIYFGFRYAIPPKKKK